MSNSCFYSIVAPKDILQDIIIYSNILTRDYIWHKEPFKLSLSSYPSKTSFSENNCLTSGKTAFGDCIEDEWFIVYVLYQISAKYTTVVISIHDDDGQFLLIEAADYLQEWMEPQNTASRVFILHSNIHILPLDMEPCESILDAPKRLSTRTVASNDIQTCIHQKLAHFSTNIQNIQYTQVYIPIEVAHLLHYNPQLVAYAVEYFHSRDPGNFKVCLKMDKFIPKNTVAMTISLTRLMYAMLVSQDGFQMPQIWDQELKTVQEKFVSKLNTEQDNHHTVEVEKIHTAFEIGVKISCGFEMIYHDSYWKSIIDGNLSYKTYSFDTDKEWKLYQKRLEAFDYFKGEMEGSKLYNSLLVSAKEKFLQEKDVNNIENPFLLMEELLKKPLVSITELSQRPSEANDWIFVDSVQIENDIKQKSKNTTVDDLGEDEWSDLDEIEKQELENIDEMATGVKSFISQESGVEGAVFPAEVSRDLKSEHVHLDTASFLQSVMASLGIDNQDLEELAGKKFDSGNATPFEEEDQNEELETSFKEYLESMDQELLDTKMGSASDSLIGDKTDVEMDVNLVKNLMESFSAQQGLAGPASNIIQSLGIPLPKLDKD